MVSYYDKVALEMERYRNGSGRCHGLVIRFGKDGDNERKPGLAMIRRTHIKLEH